MQVFFSECVRGASEMPRATGVGKENLEKLSCCKVYGNLGEFRPFG